MQTEPVVISYEMAVKGLKAAVELKGADYIYENPDVYREGEGQTCKYFDQVGNPSCLIGHVFSFYGVEPFRYTSALNISIVNSLTTKNKSRVRFEDIRTKWLLAYAQINQDRWLPWGDSVEFAIKSAERKEIPFYSADEDV